MFERAQYKKIAKAQLKGRYATPVLITLFDAAVWLILSIPTFTSVDSFSDLKYALVTGNTSAIVGAAAQAGSSNIILELVSYFVTAVIFIAEARFYIVMSRTTEKQTFQTFIKGFSLWLQGFLAYLWSFLWTFLWSLLFLIPGIVKSIAYSQMFFIISEHPEVGVRKAMKLSMAMTKGYKGDLFVMALSFLGWMILSGFTFGILGLWLIPYMEMSFTNAYHALKAQALKNGTLTPEDFGPADPTLDNPEQKTDENQDAPLDEPPLITE